MLHECYKSNTNLINIKWLTFLQKQSNDIRHLWLIFSLRHLHSPNTAKPASSVEKPTISNFTCL